MKKQIQVAPVVHRLIKFLTLIEDGKFKVPTFQREFVWGDKEKVELFDSISKEYPIGSILLWQPKNKFQNKSNIGPYEVKYSDVDNFFYVLDGFQRLSTLFGCLTNPNKTSLQHEQDELPNYSMFYDLDTEEFKMQKNHTKLSLTDIPVYTLIDTYAFLDFIDELREQIQNKNRAKLYIDRAKKLSSTLIDYQIPSIEIFGGNIKDAVDIFSRVNSKGVEISPDWMLSALTSNEKDGFNLGELLSELKQDLKEYNFGDIKREVLVQCIQNSFGKIFFDQKIESVAELDNFQEVSITTIESIKKAIRFLFEELAVIDRKLLPYNNQLIFLTYFFNNIDEPNTTQIKKLKEWFWITTYSNYFTTSLSNVRKTFEQFQKFVFDESLEPVYYNLTKKSFQTAKLPKSVSSGSVRSNALQLFLLNYANEPKPIDSKNIDSLKTFYMYKNHRNHSTLFPIMVYTKSSDLQYPFKFEKPKEMAYLLEDEELFSYQEKYFLNEKMVQWHKAGDKESIQKERLHLIEIKEREFVEKLRIEYISITSTTISL